MRALQIGGLLTGLMVGLVACAGGTHPGPESARPHGAPPPPSVELRSFDGRRGVFRIHNKSRRMLRRVALGLRGVGCDGPKATQTTVKVFDLRLKPGERQSFAFQLDHKCQKAHVAVATQ